MIRQAVASDAEKAVPLILQAIGHIEFVLTGTTDSQEAASILSDFFGQEDNHISYQNALVMEEEGELVGVAIFYDWMHRWSALLPRSRVIPTILSPLNRKRRSFTWMPSA